MISKYADWNPAGINLPLGGIAGNTGFNPATEDVKRNMLGALGSVLIINNIAYRLVLFDNGAGNVAAANNGVAHWKALSPSTGVWTVTSDFSDGLGSNLVAGIFRGVIVDGYYCLIQCGGVGNCTVDASTVAGDHMISGSTDLTFGRTAAASAPVGVCFGTALEADTAQVAAVALRNMLDY